MLFKRSGSAFQKLQWKLVLMFIMLILSVMIIAGTFLLNSVTTFYHNQFRELMDSEFSPGSEINNILASALSSSDPSERVKEAVEAFSTNRLGINGKSRNFYILDGTTGDYISGSTENTGDIELSANIISAMAGTVGNRVSVNSSYMDYAYPVMENGQTKYIIYIKDSKQELLAVSHNMFITVLQAMLFGSLIAIVIGYFMSRSITVPIRNLTNKASKIAEGNFDSVIEVRSQDEIGILTTTFNIMAARLKKTLDEIASEKDKIEVIIKNMADGVMAFNAEGKSTHINPAACKMLQLDRRKTYRFNTLFRKLGIDLTLQDAMSNNPDIPKQWQFETKDATINAHFAPFKTEGDKKEGIVVAFQDITQQQKLDESRRAFVADVSHELRTPLTNIKSYSETLLENDIDDRETQRSFLEVIESEADRMTRLVKDLLVLSQLDHSKSALKLEPVDIEKLVISVIKKMEIEAKNHKLTMTYVTGSPTTEIMVTRDRLEQVFINIISNAIKYTPEGGSITVICGQQEDHVYVKVTDNGIGIPEQDLPMIFERFYRVDKARSREQGGTGLGLAIAKEIVEAHHGKISIDSVYGSGTTVTIRLPIEQEPEKKK